MQNSIYLIVGLVLTICFQNCSGVKFSALDESSIAAKIDSQPGEVESLPETIATVNNGAATGPTPAPVEVDRSNGITNIYSGARVLICNKQVKRVSNILVGAQVILVDSSIDDIGSAPQGAELLLVNSRATNFSNAKELFPAIRDASASENAQYIEECARVPAEEPVAINTLKDSLCGLAFDQAAGTCATNSSLMQINTLTGRSNGVLVTKDFRVTGISSGSSVFVKTTSFGVTSVDYGVTLVIY